MSTAKQQSITFRGAAAVSSVLLIILLLAVQLACSKSDKPVRGSYLIIWNSSGLDVRFEQVVIDDQVIWGGAETFLSKETFEAALAPLWARQCQFFISIFDKACPTEINNHKRTGRERNSILYTSGVFDP